MALPRSYQEGGSDPLSRLWWLRGDTGSPPGLGQVDAKRLIETTASVSVKLKFRLPVGQDGATGATIKVATDTTVPPLVVLTLQRTMSPSESASTLTISPSTSTYPIRTMADIAGWVGSLDQGWEMCISSNDPGSDEWFDPAANQRWLSGLKSARWWDIPAMNLSLTPSEAAITAYGDRADFGTDPDNSGQRIAIVPFYQLGMAALRSRHVKVCGSDVDMTDELTRAARQGVFYA